jgi:hypothetical protein
VMGEGTKEGESEESKSREPQQEREAEIA